MLKRLSLPTTTDRLAPVHPGEVLAEEFLAPKRLSAAALARHIGVPANRISEIVAGRRAITGDTALRLATAFGTTAEFWMGLQMRWELEVARDAPALPILPLG
ncbi:HigA family addiction module antidote protein [Gemmobacter straminiformis]|uniref:HigA family addiction module antidote protein n=1 Tax=Paragemmobacter straminiformis TaxID=2045119 RepID=A0A842I3E6_9RHOB|nr:HigA family addiction module antidote protein [Gemmobacter straminiformis]